MYNHITRFFLWLFPIIKQAAIQVLAEEMHRLAYSDRKSRLARNPDGTYSFIQKGTGAKAKVDLDESIADYARKDVDWTMSMYHRPPVQHVSTQFGDLKETHEGRGFHDVLMVAFDVSGPDARSTHEWLMEQMPKNGVAGLDDEIYLDDWWIANDERFTDDDRDSAVFVSNGHQRAARKKLRAFGLVD